MSLNTIEQKWIFQHPRSKVWAAITDKAHLSKWLMPTDFEPVLGHEFTFKTDPAPGFDGIVHCKLLDIRPETSVSYSWHAGDLESVVSMTLSDHTEGTQLLLEHTGFGLTDIIPRLILGKGWKTLIRGSLVKFLSASLEEA